MLLICPKVYYRCIIRCFSPPLEFLWWVEKVCYCVCVFAMVIVDDFLCPLVVFADGLKYYPMWGYFNSPWVIHEEGPQPVVADMFVCYNPYFWEPGSLWQPGKIFNGGCKFWNDLVKIFDNFVKSKKIWKFVSFSYLCFHTKVPFYWNCGNII